MVILGEAAKLSFLQTPESDPDYPNAAIRSNSSFGTQRFWEYRNACLPTSTSFDVTAISQLER
jgi:hypothetical protein